MREMFENEARVVEFNLIRMSDGRSKGIRRFLARRLAELEKSQPTI